MKVPETSGSFMEVLGSFHPILTGRKLPSPSLVSLASELASVQEQDVFSESAKQIFLRFRELPVPSADRGRVPCWANLLSAFVFFAGKVFFGLNRKTPLCFFIFPEGPRVEVHGQNRSLSELQDSDSAGFSFSVL